MANERPGRLAEALRALMARHGVGLAHVAKYGGLAVNVVRYIRDGTTKHPREATVAKIARGVTTPEDPPHVPDPQDEAEALRDLRAAGGYTTLDEIEADTLLELGLWALLRRERKVRAWAAFVARRAHLTAAEVERLDADNEPP
jgi:transcriptional regulator with XRE-family HTH domain